MNNVMTTSSAPESTSQSLWQRGDENQKAWNFVLVAGVLLSWFVLGRFFEFVLGVVFSKVLVDSPWILTLERSPIRVGYVLGAVAALVTGIVLRRKPVVNTFGLEVMAELKKVSWSPWNVTWKSTIAVLVTVAICSVIFFGFDVLWGYLTEFLVS